MYLAQPPFLLPKNVESKCDETRAVMIMWCGISFGNSDSPGTPVRTIASGLCFGGSEVSQGDGWDDVGTALKVCAGSSNYPCSEKSKHIADA